MITIDDWISAGAKCVVPSGLTLEFRVSVTTDTAVSRSSISYLTIKDPNAYAVLFCSCKWSMLRS